ncbi:MAG: hypothetical protein ABIN74_10840 [Ferruginibacter sp.]
MLNSHENILCHHELFNPAGIFYALELRNTDFGLGTIAERNQSPVQFLSKVWATNLDYSCIGFKMTGTQNSEILNAVLSDKGIKKIVLKRHNRIKTYVSKLLAERRGIWEEYKDEPLEHICGKVNVDFDVLQQEIITNELFYKEIETQLQNSKEDFCQVYYETLKERDTQDRLLAFLECTMEKLTEKSRKQNPDDLKSLIVNYDELKFQCQENNLALDFN